jgi:hypothetical protein
VAGWTGSAGRPPDDGYFRLSADPEPRIVRVRLRADLPWMYPVHAYLGRRLKDMVDRAVYDSDRECIALARRYRVDVPIVYWWERDGLRIDRLAVFSIRPDGDIDVAVQHLGIQSAQGGDE